MKKNCTFIFRGKTYSTDRIQRILLEELPSRSQQASIDFLKQFLGMSEEEVIIITGLIDGKSLGRFKADGKILLSEFATPDVAYHEAFHRVWRMFLSPQERTVAINEIKRRKNLNSILEDYAKIYPELSTNELIEEYLADEFSDYTLNSDYKIELPVKSLFQRLIDFLKLLLGLKPQSVRMIYDKILSGKYKGKAVSQRILKDADKVIVDGVEFSIEQKNEIIQALTQRFVKAMLQANKDIEIFANKGSISVYKILDEYVIPSLYNEMLDANEDNGDYVDALYNDAIKVLQQGKPVSESVFLTGLFRNLSLIGLKITDDSEDASEGMLEEDEKGTREFQASIEVDPRSKISAKIKFLLSSLTTDEVTPAFGLRKPVSWTKAFMQIITRMARVPSSVFMQEFKKLNLPYVQDLVSLLETDINFENKFISSLAMTENKFMKMIYKEGDIYFIDANSGTRTDRILNEWKNNVSKLVENWDAWTEKLNILNAGKPTNEDIANHFGLVLNPAIENLQTHLRTILQQAVKYTGDKPQSNNIFKELKIDGYIKDVATLQSAFEDANDLTVFIGGKKLYPIGLNTQQTIVLNAIKYAQSLFTPEMSQTDKINLLREYAPMQVSEFNTTQLADGSYLVNNLWLEKILNGEKIELVIPYFVESQNGESEIEKLEEPDLMAYHITGALTGIIPSLKHGDRSTFFAYNFGKPLYPRSLTGTVGESLTILENNLIEQIELELKFIQDVKASKFPVQVMGNITEGAFGKEILGKDYDKVLETGEIPTAKVRQFVSDQFTEFKKYVENLGLLESAQTTQYKADGTSYKIDQVKGLSQSILRDWNVDAMLASAFVNEVSNHIFEQRFFSGSPQSFNSGTNLFKRLVPQSSTGNLAVNSDKANLHIRQSLDQEHTLYNPRTGETVVKNTAENLEDNYFRAVTGEERSDYESTLLDLALDNEGNILISKLTGKQESKLFMLFEDGFLKDFPNTPIEELKKIYLPKFELYEQKYKEINENDGESYMTLPAFKNFLIRLGNWNDGFELVYQTEMKIASLKSKDDIADLEIEFKGVKFKPFEINPAEYKGRKVNGWKERVVDGKLIKLSPTHTLKTQFAGYSIPEEYYKNQQELLYLFNSVYKTAQHLLQPSAIIGTNLQLMNFSLIQNDIQIYHMGSANKVGGVDPKIAARNILNDNDDLRRTRDFISDIAERGLDFYDKDGYFNDEALTKNVDILTYLSDWSQLKNQVEIGNKVKEEIKGSTQSLKILISNLVVNKTLRFPEAKQLLDDYKKVIEEMVERNKDELFKRIGFNPEEFKFTTLNELKKAILESSQMLSAPDNVRNAIENFFESPEVGIEAIPMKNKIENVLYALISNGIISFNRPGSSYPQVASTGYEALGTRNINRSDSSTLKFYEPVFDKDGNVIKVNPAEIILPLPDQWIEPLLRWAKTNNLVKAIDKLNADIEKRPDLFQVKGLRIPNQQFSSNDFLQIKKFNLPTMQNYVIVPSEIVVKVGSDFDIDKLSIYWADDTISKIFGITDEEILEQYDSYVNTSVETGIDPMPFDMFYKRRKGGDTLDRRLLNLERQLLLHPRNVHHLLLPLTDEIFVKDIYGSLVKEGVIKPPAKSFFGSVLPQTNTRNTIIFVKGKQGVGPVALSITNSATSQADGLELNLSYVKGPKTKGSTKLLFDGHENNYRMDNYTDSTGTVISEVSSQLLTTQVDNVKNPTAVLMNINMQTLGMIGYLSRRGIPAKSIVLFLQQPLIKEYLKRQAINEAIFNKNVKGEIRKQELVENLLENYGFVYKDVIKKMGSQSLIKDSETLSSAKSEKIDERQVFYFLYFLELIDQARAFGDYQRTQTSDTKTLKDKQALDETDFLEAKVNFTDMIPSDQQANINTNGVIAPFKKYGRESYRIYNPFYRIQTSNFGSYLLHFKSAVAETLTSDKKDRARQTIENDFILFIIHNFILNKNEFNRLMKDDSVAKRVIELKEKMPSNEALKAFFPVLKNTIDRTDKSRIDNLRVFEKELSHLDSNDLSQSLAEIAEADIELYNDIIKLLMFQTGLNISPFNYRGIVPVGLNKYRSELNEYEFLYQDILKQAVDIIDNFSADAAKATFQQFEILFAANNPQFLRNNFYQSYPLPLIKIWDRASKSHLLKSIKGREQTQLGDAYQKQYFVELINPNLLTTNQTQEKNEISKVFDEEIPFTEYEEVKDEVLALPEGLLESNYAKLQQYIHTNYKIGKKVMYKVDGKYTEGRINSILSDDDGRYIGFNINNEDVSLDRILDDQLKGEGEKRLLEPDQSTSQYSLSLKLYEDFIKLNQLYVGDEILPLIGESEYYRYLVPMLLKMNPRVSTEFTMDIKKSVINQAFENDLFIDDIEFLGSLDYSEANGLSVSQVNTNFINVNRATTKTIVHELVHRTIQKEYDKGGEFADKINELYNYADERAVTKELYGYYNAKEFLAEALSNPYFMQELNNIPYKEQTIWTYLMTLVSDFINNLLGIELNSDSVLAEVVRASEQILNHNIEEVGKQKQVTLSTIGKEIVENWNNYFPQYDWMNLEQKQMAAKLVEEGKITLTCEI